MRLLRWLVILALRDEEVRAEIVRIQVSVLASAATIKPHPARRKKGSAPGAIA